MAIPSQEQVALLTDYDIHSAYSTAYRTIYTNIRLDWQSEKNRQQTILLVTPAHPQAQASAVANVAIAAAQSGTPTILVDAYLDAPGLHQRFGIHNSIGLSDLLIQATFSEQQINAALGQTFVPGLRLLSAGTTVAQVQENSQLFTLVRLQQILNGLQQTLDSEGHSGLIVLHSTPVLMGTEASLLASLVEQTFLLIVAGRTTRAQSKRAHEQLLRAHAHLAGAILLDVQ